MTDQPPSLRPGPHDAITDIDGIRVGHFTNLEAATGTTVSVDGFVMISGVNPAS